MLNFPWFSEKKCQIFIWIYIGIKPWIINSEMLITSPLWRYLDSNGKKLQIFLFLPSEICLHWGRWVSLCLSRVGGADALLLCEPQIPNFEVAFLYEKTSLGTRKSAHLALFILPQKRRKLGQRDLMEFLL